MAVFIGKTSEPAQSKASTVTYFSRNSLGSLSCDRNDATSAAKFSVTLAAN